jgi:hypothetical protein
VAPFRFQEELVALLVGEANDLVFQGGAVARADALDPPAVERGLVQVGADDPVSFPRGVGDGAGQLFHVEQSVPPFVQGEDVVRALAEGVGEVTERARGLIAMLQVHAAEVDALL